uniref:KATNB1-like protein 1 n=1 Tax=Myxine glutinosa TaxID=7769 RepID=UPI00358E8021
MAEKENEIPPVGSAMDPRRAQHLDKPDSTSEENMSRSHLSDVDPAVEIDELCKELSKEHNDMMQVLFSRKLKLEAALTFWKRNPEDLVSYLFRVHDLCVVADCVGIVTKSFIESDELLSFGACVDLLPLIHALLKSRYEKIWLWGRERGERGAGCAVVGLHFRCSLPGSVHHMDRNVCGHPQWTAVRLRPSTTRGWTYGSTWHLCHTGEPLLVDTKCTTRRARDTCRVRGCRIYFYSLNNGDCTDWWWGGAFDAGMGCSARY